MIGRRGGLSEGFDRDRLPLGLVHLEIRVRDEQVPDDRLESFAVRRDVVGVNGRYDDACISDRSCEPAIFADDSDNPRADLAGKLQGGHEIWRDVFLQVAAADRQDEQGIFFFESRAAQPFDKDGGPAFVIRARSEFGNVIGWRVAFETADFAEIVDGVGSVGGAAPDPKDEESTTARPDSDELADALLAILGVELGDDFGGFAKVLRGIGHDGKIGKRLDFGSRKAR